MSKIKTTYIYDDETDTAELIELEEVGGLEEENKKLKEENEKLKDQFMIKLAMYYNLPSTSNEMARLKEWDYGKRYDEVKSAMRREIMRGE